ncbi:MAG: CPBP family intramembrane metalloprotease, partial [Novosphingobium sp.]|nr:CPBP family intramembrane metalloprotease [Novosphingobium sp.]
MKKHIRLLLVALSILAIYGSVIYFDKVIPLLDIEISTDKQGMLEKAKEISKKYNIGPQEFRQVIYFNSEPNIQNYIELELNEQENSNQNFIKDKSLYQYYQYTWQVRHFDQYDKNESVIKFTPDGKFYGFIEYIPENKYLPSLDESQAKELVEQFLKTENKIDLNDYIEVSKSSETRINGRVDHNFVYQKNVTDDNLDNLKYRITLGVCGNKITVFNPYIDVPEVFNKKFAQLGVLGETISYFANMFTYIFYIFFGFLFGFVYLSRINWLMTRKSIVLGIILAIAELIYKLNEISIIWINYNTSNSFYSHLVNHLVGDFVLFLVSVFIYSSTIAVAEGLTRLAFADHLQFFKLLNFKVLSSKEFLKKSLISYLILPLEVLFALLFYTFGFKLFGWWISSTSLINPNILSTYFPGISVLAQAFKSAIWEECLFRAIPLSFFYLICKKLKYKNIILCLGLIIQALMFSASHANYLAIPEYLRVIELIVPSIVFGLIYLRWGLFPVILIHYTYDIIFLSLPILTSNNIIIEKLIIVTGFFLPILVSLMTYVIRLYNLKGSKQEDLSSEFYNKNWNPKLIELDNNQKQREPDLKSFDYKHIYIVSLGYVCFFLMSLCFTSLKPDIPNIVITKDQAIDIAKNFLKNKDVDLDPSWSILTSIYNPA